jgi:hypothetical protein
VILDSLEPPDPPLVHGKSLWEIELGLPTVRREHEVDKPLGERSRNERDVVVRAVAGSAATDEVHPVSGIRGGQDPARGGVDPLAGAGRGRGETGLG